MGVKGFQKGHIVSKETRMKISKANDGNFFAKCDYCGEKYHTKKTQSLHFIHLMTAFKICQKFKFWQIIFG